MYGVKWCMLRPTEAFAQSIILERCSQLVEDGKVRWFLCQNKIIDIVVLQFGNVVPFIFLFRMFCLGWQILARAQGVVLLLHPLATQTVGLQKVQLDGQDANAAKTLAQIDFALADLNFLAEQN